MGRLVWRAEPTQRKRRHHRRFRPAPRPGHAAWRVAGCARRRPVAGLGHSVRLRPARRTRHRPSI